MSSIEIAPGVHLAGMTDNFGETLGTHAAAMPPWSIHKSTPESLIRYLNTVEPAAPRYALLVDGRLAGGAALRMNWLRGPYLQFLAILPEYQNRKLGDAVLNWMQREATSRGEKNLYVACSDFNTQALKFYERFGFKRIGAVPDLVTDGVSEILHHKRI